MLAKEEKHQIIPDPGQQQLPRRRPDDIDCRVGKSARNSLNAQELALGLRTRHPTPEGEDITPRIVSLTCRVSIRDASLQLGSWGTCSQTSSEVMSQAKVGRHQRISGHQEPEGYSASLPAAVRKRRKHNCIVNQSQAQLTRYTPVTASVLNNKFQV